jgi:hypothetical protein
MWRDSWHLRMISFLYFHIVVYAREIIIFPPSLCVCVSPSFHKVHLMLPILLSQLVEMWNNLDDIIIRLGNTKFMEDIWGICSITISKHMQKNLKASYHIKVIPSFNNFWWTYMEICASMNFFKVKTSISMDWKWSLSSGNQLGSSCEKIVKRRITNNMV